MQFLISFRISNIVYKSIGEVNSKNDDRFTITPMNGITEVSSFRLVDEVTFDYLF